MVALRSYSRGEVFIEADNLTLLWGDALFLPAYAGVSSLIIRRHRGPKGIYGKRWWHLLVLILGFGLSAWIEITTVRAGCWGMTEGTYQVSKIYHRFIFGVIFYLLVSVLPLVTSWKRPLGIPNLASLFLLCYLAVAWWEMRPLAQDSVQEVMNLREILPT